MVVGREHFHFFPFFSAVISTNLEESLYAHTLQVLTAYNICILNVQSHVVAMVSFFLYFVYR